MKQNRWSVIVFALALGCRPAVAPECPEPRNRAGVPDPGEKKAAADPLAGLDIEIEATMAAFDVPGLSIAIVRDGEVVHSRGYGVRSKSKREPVDPDTVFAIASNTKAFAATLVGLLVEEGKVGWEDEVVKHLPDMVLWNQQATKHMRVKDLLSHRSGLATWAGDLAWIGSRATVADVMAKLRHVPARNELHETFGYCNLMFVVAGELLRVRTGKQWDEMLRERVFEPLGMKRTTTRIKGIDGQANVAAPHMKVDGEWRELPWLDVDAVGPAASINSSVADLSKWLLLQLGEGEYAGKRVIPAAAVTDLRVAVTPMRLPKKDMLDPPRHFNAYGLGWFLADYRGRLLVSHGGGLPGMTSQVVLVPDEELGVVVLTNSESEASVVVAQMVVDRFLVGAAVRDYVAFVRDRGSKEEPKKLVAPPTSNGPPLDRFAGTYENELLGRVRVTIAPEPRLEAVDHGRLSCPLVRTGRDTFECTWTEPMFETSTVRFETSGGRAQALSFTVRPDFVDPLEYRFTR
jgi:CubicO group peptidase (beta-lactamase class C family)